VQFTSAAAFLKKHLSTNTAPTQPDTDPSRNAEYVVTETIARFRCASIGAPLQANSISLLIHFRICLFRVILATNDDYFTKQHQAAGWPS
jgi:hypothetical protein